MSSRKWYGAPPVYDRTTSTRYREPERTSIIPPGLNRTIAARSAKSAAGPSLSPTTASIKLADGVASSSAWKICVCSVNGWLVQGPLVVAAGGDAAAAGSTSAPQASPDVAIAAHTIHTRVLATR